MPPRESFQVRFSGCRAVRVSHSSPNRRSRTVRRTSMACCSMSAASATTTSMRPRCRNYAEWLAEQTLLQFGDVRALSSAITDVDGMLRVLGKAPEHFRPGDSMTINTLAQICRQMLTESMDAADRTLASKVQDWAPSPLRASLNSAGGYEDWLIAEQVPLVTRKQRASCGRQARRRSRHFRHSHRAWSLQIASASGPCATREGWLRLLSPPDRKQFEAQLLEARRGLELRIAEDMARNFASLPSTYEAFEQLDGMLREHQQALQPYRARAGSAALQDAYEAAAAERAGNVVARLSRRS